MTHHHWQTFLTTRGAHWSGQRVDYFGDEPQNTIAEKHAALQGGSVIMCDLSHYGLIRAEGPESADFLQNQLCNDVREVTPLHSQYNGYCTPKGRALAFFRLFQRDDDYYLRLPREILEPVLKRLRMFVLMSKTELGDASDQLIRIGVAGPDAGRQLSALMGETPNEVNAVYHSGDLSIICLQPGSRFEVYGPDEAMQHLWQQLEETVAPVGAGAWELLDIHAGLPEVYAQTQEAFVPQMLNLQAIGALSFKKGCYPGQEIVARMHYLGKLKRRMYLAHIEEDIPVQPGDTLYAESSASGQGVGKVVRAQSNPDGGVDLLAVIEISSAEQGSLRLHDANGPMLQLQALPYDIEQPQ
ncbi:MAG TPA: folate-binding protein [Gammaproteobacteria bacterium]|nr:folate-binding protein [Gammaproteobacteria bacterium]